METEQQTEVRPIQKQRLSKPSVSPSGDLFHNMIQALLALAGLVSALESAFSRANSPSNQTALSQKDEA